MTLEEQRGQQIFCEGTSGYGEIIYTRSSRNLWWSYRIKSSSRSAVELKLCKGSWYFIRSSRACVGMRGSESKP